MCPWWENDLEALYADAFNDGPLVFSGSSTGCVLKVHDIQASGLGSQDVTDREVDCHYATAALLVPPTIGSLVTVAGVSYLVRHKDDKDAGTTVLYLTAVP